LLEEGEPELVPAPAHLLLETLAFLLVRARLELGEVVLALDGGEVRELDRLARAALGVARLRERADLDVAELDQEGSDVVLVEPHDRRVLVRLGLRRDEA